MSGGPLVMTLDAIDSGAATMGEITRTTGLRRDVVEAAVDHLRLIGRLRSDLPALCPSAGCGSCPSGSGGTPGCGPVLLVLAPLPR